MKRLTDYEAAWVLGGAERVALTMFVTMVTAGQLEVACKRQRVKEGEAPLTAAEGSAALRIETAALDLLPESGLPVDEFVARLAAKPAIKTLDAALSTQGVSRPRVLPRFSPLHRELREQPATGVRRVAVLGVEGIEDARLRDIFEHPLPDTPKYAKVHPIRDNTFDGTIGPTPGIIYGP
ncbi:hypothetical protein ABZS29_08080 [Kribbella sp. NPDC005582]|uniref:hypothetical protein n=1 Tax=Kribbella sp. NPDC005582 TaxID=3156893 RepID=UPI0033A8D2B1